MNNMIYEIRCNGETIAELKDEYMAEVCAIRMGGHVWIRSGVDE